MGWGVVRSVCVCVYVYVCIYVCVTKAKLSLHSIQAACQKHTESLMDENIHVLRAFGDICQALRACYR